MSSETGCSVSESTYIRTEKERYFSGVRNFVIYLAILYTVGLAVTLYNF